MFLVLRVARTNFMEHKFLFGKSIILRSEKMEKLSNYFPYFIHYVTKSSTKLLNKKLLMTAVYINYETHGNKLHLRK